MSVALSLSLSPGFHLGLFGLILIVVVEVRGKGYNSRVVSPKLSCTI